MKEGRGTLKELTALWRQLDPRGKWDLVEMAYSIKVLMDKYPNCRHDMPSYKETMEMRARLNGDAQGSDKLGSSDSRGEEKSIVPEAERPA